MVRHLTTAAVDDSCYLVGYHKFQILCCKLIANKEPIFYLHGSQDLIAESRPPARHGSTMGSERVAQPQAGSRWPQRPAAAGCGWPLPL